MMMMIHRRGFTRCATRMQPRRVPSSVPLLMRDIFFFGGIWQSELGSQDKENGAHRLRQAEQLFFFHVWSHLQLFLLVYLIMPACTNVPRAARGGSRRRILLGDLAHAAQTDVKTEGGREDKA